MAVHVSNLHFDLRPVVSALAAALGKQAIWIEDDGSEDEETSDWVLVTGNDHLVEKFLLSGERILEGEPRRPLWTDDYTNVLSAIWSEE